MIEGGAVSRSSTVSVLTTHYGDSDRERPGRSGFGRWVVHCFCNSKGKEPKDDIPPYVKAGTSGEQNQFRDSPKSVTQRFATTLPLCFKQCRTGSVTDNHAFKPLLEWNKPIYCSSGKNPVEDIFGLVRGKHLGFGLTADVYLYQDPNNGNKYAVKEVKRESPQFLSEQKGEACGLLLPPHPHLTKTHAVLAFDARFKQYIPIKDLAGITDDKYRGLPIKFVISEYVDGMDLFDVATNLSSENRLQVSARVTREIESGLEAIHQAGFMYRDVKPENIMLSIDGRGALKSAKLVDYGFLRRMPDESDTLSLSGTPGYMSPEIYKSIRLSPFPISRLQSSSYNEKADLFGLGATMVSTTTQRLSAHLFLDYMNNSTLPLHQRYYPEDFYHFQYNVEFSELKDIQKREVLYSVEPQLKDKNSKALMDDILRLTSAEPENRGRLTDVGKPTWLSGLRSCFLLK